MAWYDFAESLANFGSTLSGGILQNKGIRQYGANDLAAIQQQGENQSNYFAGMLGLGEQQAGTIEQATEAKTKMIVVVVIVLGVVVVAGLVIWKTVAK